ncbi:MAG: hypothetical protein ACYC6W_11770 [Nitrosotalea sp.]
MQIDSNRQYTQSDLPSNVFNAGNGDVRNYNGQAVRVQVNPNGTRNLSPLGDYTSYQNQQQYQQGVNTAVSSLKDQGNSLDTQYSDLLNKILGQGSVAMNTATTAENNYLGARGLQSQTGVGQNDLSQAQLGVQTQNQAAVGSLGYTQAQLKNELANNIANLQAGGAGTAATLPLQYGSLAMNQAANLANIAQTNVATGVAGSQGGYVSVPGMGLYNLSTGAFEQGQGTLPMGGQVIQKNGQYFLNVP